MTRDPVRGPSSPRRRFVPVVVWALALLAGVGPVEGQTLRGLVLERETDTPIDLATVILVGEERDTLASVLTDSTGFFSVVAPEGGSYRLTATALGYRAVVLGPYAVEDDGARVVQILLSPRPVRLAGLLVETDRDDEPEVQTLVHTGFYDRLAEGRGEFITPGELARSREKWTPQLFWGMSLAVVSHGTRGWGPWDDRVLIRPADGGVRGACQPRIIVDGVWIREMLPGESLSDLVPKDDLRAVEVYRAPFGAPMQYQGTDQCGVVLFWTTAY